MAVLFLLQDFVQCSPRSSLPSWSHSRQGGIGKDPDAGRDWGQKEKGTTEDEMAGWHH